MIDKTLAKGFGLPEITIVTDCHITPEIAEQCFDMIKDSEYLKLPISLEDVKNKFHAIPDFCFVFMHKDLNKPVGFYIILPFSDDAVLQYMNDEISFSSIRPSDLERPKEGELYNLFFDTSVIYKQYRTSCMARLAFSILLNAVIEKARNNAYCNYVLVDQFKESAQLTAEKMKLSYLKPHKYTNGLSGHIYGGVFNYKVYKNLPNYPTLEHAYNNKTANKILAGGRDLWEVYKNKKNQ